jgi:transcriptional regulator with XRE-family HTH domain
MTEPGDALPTPDALLAALPTLVETECRRRGLTQRAASRELGFSPSTVTRIIQGHGVDARSFCKVLRWLDLTAEWLREPAAADGAYQRGWNDCAVRVRAALVADCEAI